MSASVVAGVCTRENSASELRDAEGGCAAYQPHQKKKRGITELVRTRPMRSRCCGWELPQPCFFRYSRF